MCLDVIYSKYFSLCVNDCMNLKWRLCIYMYGNNYFYYSLCISSYVLVKKKKNIYIGYIIWLLFGKFSGL